MVILEWYVDVTTLVIGSNLFFITCQVIHHMCLHENSLSLYSLGRHYPNHMFLVMSLSGGGTPFTSKFPSSSPIPQGNMLANPNNMVTPHTYPTPRAKYGLGVVRDAHLLIATKVYGK